jgi:multidrug resistance efflux pump
MSPIDGIVTGVYKHPGDPVQPGEPVIRVEDNSSILLMAKIVYRGPIALGATVTVTTQLFGMAGPPTTIKGAVVSIRGAQEDDHWDVIARCDNLDPGGNIILPLGYRFDFDDTAITIS